MNLNRRNFIFGSAAAVTLAGNATAKTGLRQLKPGEKRTIGMIGCGKQMRDCLIPQFLNARYAKNVKIVAVCDCDKTRARSAAARVNKAYKNNDCKIVADFREIVRDPAIDMVCVGTPDHWHAYICVEAMKHGKDVYCEKPLTYSVDEARKLIETTNKYGRIFQTGSMQRSWREFRTAVALVRGGVIGDVRYVDANFGVAGDMNASSSNPVRFWYDPRNAAKEGAPNPDVDWKMWLGPAKWRPYSDQLSPRGNNRFYPMFWRFDDEIALGYCGDWGAHHLDIAQWGLDMDRSGPYRLIASDQPYSTNLYHGGRRQFGLKMLFKKPYGDVVLEHGPFSLLGGRHAWGTVFYGTKGIVAVNRGKIAVWADTGLVKPDFEIRRKIEDASFMPEKIVAASIGKDYGTQATVRKDNRLRRTLDTLQKKYAAEIEKSGIAGHFNHVWDFCRCVESRQQPVASAEAGSRTCVLCLMCNMSYRYDIGFDWDPVRMTFANGTGNGVPLTREGDCNGWKVEV